MEGDGVNVWHNNNSNISTLEKKTLKIYSVLEENICRVLEKNPQKSTYRLSELGASKDIIHHQIKTLGKSYRSCRSIPHKLTPQQAQHGEDICQFIGNPMDDRYIRRIVT